MPGNSLGKRKWFKYDSDSGESYSYLTDVDLGTAAGATLDATLPNLPRRFKPRVIYVQSTVAGVVLRKRLIVPTNDSSLFAGNISQMLSIDGVAFTSTGRRGEAVSFASNA